MFPIFESFASEKKFLKCLGEEELNYHKKNLGGAYINLNKMMITEFIQMSETLSLKEKFQNKICQNKTFQPSLMTLYIILKYQEAAFSFHASERDVVQNSKDKKTMNEVINRSFFALTNFIDDMQSRAIKPNCIIDQIPELRELYKKARYTLENIGTRRTIAEIKNLKKLIEKLSSKETRQACSRVKTSK